MKKLEISTRAKWRTWLSKNHGKVDAVWLVFYKKHTEKKWISYGDALDEALCFGWIDSLVKRLDEDRFLRKFTPRKPNSNWSAINKKRIEKLEAAEQLAAPGKKAVEIAKKNGSWNTIPDGEKEFEMPSELQRLLVKKHVARANFEKLPPSQQKMYLMWIASAKRDTTRERRASQAVEMLARGEKLGLK